ncbi:TetR/AcrR family transcriptional regulator [Duffyella gerundensis]|uniref:TetR/AcrR family transcriptional regulator n=1 Tax=Duffyella TaxID=3026546 RepID=UPI003F6DFDEB
MKVSKEQVQENRRRIVQTASTLFRERGFDGVGVADLMSAAGLTHGGFYKHFASKADLMAEAMRCGFMQSAEDAQGVTRDQFVAHYLSRQHRDGMGQGCVMASLGSDAARQSDAIKSEFAAGIENLLAIARADGGETRADLIATLSQMVGALVLSRGCPDDSALADEILQVCRARLLPENGEAR